MYICSFFSLAAAAMAIVVIVFTVCRRITVLCIIFYCHAFSFSGRTLIYRRVRMCVCMLALGFVYRTVPEA